MLHMVLWVPPGQESSKERHICPLMPVIQESRTGLSTDHLVIKSYGDGHSKWDRADGIEEGTRGEEGGRE